MAISKQQQDRKTHFRAVPGATAALSFPFLPCRQPEPAGTWADKDTSGDRREAPGPARLTRQEELAWWEGSVTADSRDVKPSLGPDTPPSG